eukprot:gnl/MRDRNA2_/MRDRNA2_289290_c0_seq1.p1 gnl/MRDRNA2_/MRDRNA2_289290_c0~~gnl/MRDRNA2_/MRDRNA2_289290_c0_seq1.p1  ORF type:complete len:275 (+),score=54.17 gnl/MRDRNA2_/MRDRNA2_289290_c0_seq1:41-826(+)
MAALRPVRGAAVQAQVTADMGHPDSLVYFIRHGESEANLRSRLYRDQGEGEAAERAYFETEFFNAKLTCKGRLEAEKVGTQLQGYFPADDSVRFVITSTLWRALETATLGILPLLPPDNRTSWVALDDIREAMVCEVHDGIVKHISKEKPCNMRGPLREVQGKFPHIDFSFSADEDPLDCLETADVFNKRVIAFVEWLLNLVGQHSSDVRLHVVVVSHYVFLRRLLSQLENCSDDSAGLQNCEVRIVPLSSVLALAQKQSQ